MDCSFTNIHSMISSIAKVQKRGARQHFRVKKSQTNIKNLVNKFFTHSGILFEKTDSNPVFLNVLHKSHDHSQL